ncbi:MAG: adenylate/guanylate cyclase domain-containing protein [Solirubrobacteraceae bacterium]|nr:adenylate/guanylate cyclase domain-containing protein [Solirubrobacteraceae bacterium]
MRSRRLLTAAIVALLAVGCGVVVAVTDVLRRAELQTVDARFSVRGEQPVPDDVVFVAIDERSIAELGGWPFPRGDHAELIDTLVADGAKVVALDVEFSQPSDSPADDRALREAARRAGDQLVLASASILKDSRRPFVAIGREEFEAPGVAKGDVAYRADPGGYYRRVGVIEGAPHFVTETVRLAGKPVPDDAKDDPGQWIDYVGDAGRIRTIPYIDVLDGKVPREDLEGKVVVVGPAATSLRDEHPVPTGPVMDGAEIHANAINTLLRGVPLRDAPEWWTIALLVLAGIAAPLAAAVTPVRRALLAGLLVGLGALAGVLVFGQLAFNAGTVVELLPALTAGLVGTLGALGATYATEIRRRAQQRHAFERFVPATVVEEVLDRMGGEARLAGIQRDGTVMFCDLRGFTTFAESLPADRVFEVLNTYLTEVSDAILDHGGTIVTYLGDGIMAVFGAPLAQDDHADRALAAAREILDHRLPRFNAATGQDFRIGIGLHSGAVMSGNVGSQRRMEYAAVGDVTNTAARLQGETKGTPHQLLLSESTRAALRGGDPADLVDAGEFALRGRSAPVRCWSLTPASASPDPPR